MSTRNLIFNPEFVEQLENLNEQEQRAIVKVADRLRNNLRHPSLRVKKIQGTRGIFEARGSRDLRISFVSAEINGEPYFILRKCGHHDSVLKNP